jgi:hypothetical protein
LYDFETREEIIGEDDEENMCIDIEDSEESSSSSSIDIVIMVNTTDGIWLKFQFQTR